MGIQDMCGSCEGPWYLKISKLGGSLVSVNGPWHLTDFLCMLTDTSKEKVRLSQVKKKIRFQNTMC